ncbi:MAG: oxidoreductase family protein [Promethearchaeota archaeon]
MISTEKNEVELILNVEQITPEKITDIFHRNGLLGKNRIEKVEIKNIQDTYSSRGFFIKLVYSKEEKRLDKFPGPNIYLKILKEGFIEDGRNEAVFYNLLKNIRQTEKKNLPIPKCYDATFSEKSGRSQIILEDLSKTHTTLKNWPIPPSNKRCFKAVESIARIHGFWWVWLDKNKEKNKNLMINLEKSEFFGWFEEQNKNLKYVLDSLGERISLKRQKLYKNVYSRFPEILWQRVSQQNKRGKKNLTIVHGDAHLWNFFYPIYPRKSKENKNTIAYLIDWQNWKIGIGMQDLAYMIGLHWYPEKRKLLEKKLIKHYYNMLINTYPDLKSLYSWEQCLYDYKLSIIWSLYIPILQCYKKKFPGVWWHHLERGILAFKDLNCNKLLE